MGFETKQSLKEKKNTFKFQTKRRQNLCLYFYIDKEARFINTNLYITNINLFYFSTRISKTKKAQKNLIFRNVQTF